MQAVWKNLPMTDTESKFRSHCPISLALDVIGDRWSLLIVRDLMFAGKRYYRELLRSDEGISSNILAERLARLVDVGVLSRTGDPTHKQKAIYSLTPMGIDLLPLVAQLGIWGRKYLPVTAETGAQAEQLEKGGAALLRKIQADLRKQHSSEPVA